MAKGLIFGSRSFQRRNPGQRFHQITLGLCLGGQFTLRQAMHPPSSTKENQDLEHSNPKGEDGKIKNKVEDFFIETNVCMNCGLCAEYCPFDAIKMDHRFELSTYTRKPKEVQNLQDLLVSTEYYAKTHPVAWAAEEAKRAKKAAPKPSAPVAPTAIAPKPTTPPPGQAAPPPPPPPQQSPPPAT